ncbi:uncharacterized protein LOC103978270 isoform X1 [Musa acuminata AAA Group]|uniref:uncharacterized protein LOC103978270 isoform X1 n=1 Tax=Musa acuminata AAA Group TaxID=214697 RepID=UPI0031D6096F
MTAAVGPPVPAAAVRPTWTAKQGRKDKGSGGMGNMLRVLRNDRDFLRERLRPLSNALGNLLWLRNLEDPRAKDVRRPPEAWPKISHPPGLSGLDLMMADFEALKVYANHLQDTCKVLFMPLPEIYDPEKVELYFSCRPHILAFRITEALSELHDKVPPFPRTVAMKIIEDEFGSPVERIFSYISEDPVAAASFGQVYRGCTLDGSVVAVKVQRPNLLHVVARDIYILRLGLALLRKIAKRKSDLCLYADELGKGLVGELDYTREAANATEFMEVHSQYSFMLVPKVFMKLTSKRVLTMEWLNGKNPNELLVQSKELVQENGQYLEMQTLDTKVQLLDLVKKGVDATLIQLLDTGLLHADPHPGNLCYTPDGHIGFLDFGLLCRMEKKHQLAMLASIVHISNGDWNALVYDLMEMDIVRPETNLRRVTMDLEEALGEVVFVNGIPDIKFSRVLGKIWSVALKYQFRMPPYFTLVLRSLASFEGLALAADRNFKTFQAAYNYVARKLLRDNSAAARKILYSVVFNKRRELQWQRILLFLRLGNVRSSSYGQSVREDVFETANLILRLLSSKDGTVFRRILMIADSTSLARAFISKEAIIFRKNLSAALADVFFQWMLKAIRGNGALGQRDQQYDEHTFAASKQKETMLGLSSVLSVPLLQAAVVDRRLKVIYYKKLNDVRRDPILMLKVCWSFSTIFMTAAALALNSFLIYWSESYVTSFVPRRFATGVS